MVGIVAGCRKQQSYEDWLMDAGLEYRIVSSVTEAEGVSVMVFCGGPDLGEVPERDALDRDVFDYCREHHIPMFGGCRGMQEISNFLGSPLIQDLGEKNPVHRTKIDDSSRFHDIILSNGRRWNVNSRHHQAVSIPPFDCCLSAQSEDGVWELFVSCDKQYFLTQSHPELPEMRNTEMSDASLAFIKSR